MNLSISSTDQSQFYALFPNREKPIRSPLPTAGPEFIEFLWPLLYRRGGEVPYASAVTCDIVLALDGAQIFYSFRGELLITAAVAWQANDSTRALWLWLCDSMNLPELYCNSIPAENYWGAMAFSNGIGRMGVANAEVVHNFGRHLAPAIAAWATLQN